MKQERRMNDTESFPDKRRGELLDKISALLAKTRDRGCTEAEALAAADLASRLMTKYGLSLSELESVSSPADVCDTDWAPIGNRRAHEVLRVAAAIAHFTDTRYWYNSHGVIGIDRQTRRFHEHRGVLLVFFGLAADVQVAIYLTNILRGAIDKEWKGHWASVPKCLRTNASAARGNFMRGIAERLSNRLYQMKKDTEKNEASSNNCRAIILEKRDIVQKAFDSACFKNQNRRKSLAFVPPGFLHRRLHGRRPSNDSQRSTPRL
jgi:hypothetical protein